MWKLVETSEESEDTLTDSELIGIRVILITIGMFTIGHG
jgi:hypothetical protein